MKSCGLYVRVSTDMQAQVRDGSLDTQEDKLRAYVKLRDSSKESWQVTEVYREEGRSGADDTRPQYTRLLHDAQSGRINVVLCTKLDRFSRSLLDFYKAYEQFQAKDVDFVTLEENFDTSTPAGRAMLKIALVFAELEREQTSKRTKDKMEWRAQQGLWNGGQVLGYDVDPDDHGTLKVNAEESQIVQLIFNTYLETHSYLKTAKVINEKGIRSKQFHSRRGNLRGGNNFQDTTIGHVLRNPVYVGKVTHNSVIYEGKHEGIIPLPLWEEVQECIRLYGPKRNGSRRHRMHVFLLEGLVECGWCGAAMTPKFAHGQNKKRYFYYQCSRNDHRGKDGCKMKYVPAEPLERLVSERIKEIATDDNLLEEIVQEANETSKTERDEIARKRKLLSRQLAEVKQTINNWLDLIGNGTAKKTGAVTTLLERIGEGEKRRKELEQGLMELGLQEGELKKKILDAEIMRDSLARFRDLFDEAQGEEKKFLLQLMIARIIWTPEEIKIALYDRPTETGRLSINSSVNREGDISLEIANWLRE
ncbi:MAG: recombinase family protein [Candidatus Hydrogenedentales bacterium]